MVFLFLCICLFIFLEGGGGALLDRGSSLVQIFVSLV